MCIYQDVRETDGAFHTGIQKNRAIHILFVEKRGANHIPGSTEKGGLFGTHIRTMPSIGS